MIIIDPIARGSRARFTNMIKDNLLVDFVYVGNCNEVNGDNVQRFFKLPDEFWFGYVGFMNFVRLCLLLSKHRKADFFFTGVNEWRHLFLFVVMFNYFTRNRIFAIDYNWASQKTIRNKFYYIVLKIFLNKKIRILPDVKAKKLNYRIMLV